MSNESSHDGIFIGLGFGGGMGGAPPPPLAVNSAAPYDVMMSQHHHYQHAVSTQFQQQYVDTQTNHLPPNVSVASDGTSQPIAFTRGQTQNDTFPNEEVEADVGDQQGVNTISDIEVQNRAKSIFEKLFRETEVSITVKREEEVTTAAAVDRSHLAMAHNVVSDNNAVAVPYAPSTVSSCIIPPQTMVPSSNPSSATAKAQAIAQRLYQQAPSQEQTSIIPSMLAPPPLSVITTTSTFCSNNAAKKRQECFQREQQRHFRFYLQNLEYLTKRDDELYRKQLQEIEQAHNTSSHMNSLAERHRQQQLQQQRKKQQQSELLVSKAGIGTSQRRKNEAVVKRKQGGELDRHTKRSENSVYVAGLKNATKDTEEKLRHLFSAFGKIQRITLYKNANTGKYKGDALVIYHTRKKQQQQEVHNSASDAATEEEDTAVTSVCSQLNGAVLPCGSTLVVQPANFDYTSKNTKHKQQQQQKQSQEHQQQQTHGNKTATNNLQQQHTYDKQHISSLSNAVMSKNINTTSSSKSNNTKTLLCDTESLENDDDLDDFFSSL